MEAKVLQGMQSSTWIMREKIVMRKRDSSLQFFHKYGEQKWNRIPASCGLRTRKGRPHRLVVLKISCSSVNVPVLESGSLPTLLDESKILKNKAEEIEPYLNGRCIYLVGMMGSGKTTVGEVLSEALGYSFCDCDTLIEQAVGISTVAEIFKQYGESFFRDNETEVLEKLSSMHRRVVSTGGGAVVRPINWRHMRKGISVWLDVPIEALARRITAVGTDSRPLLHQESGDPFSRVFQHFISIILDVLNTFLNNTGTSLEKIRTMKRLSTLLEERGEAYANADARVSLEYIASKLGLKDVCNVTPTAIAIEVLSQIEYFLK